VLEPIGSTSRGPDQGTLELDLVNSSLATPEGDRLPLSFPSLAVGASESETPAVVDSNGGQSRQTART